jgi:hypothetical protein
MNLDKVFILWASGAGRDDCCFIVLTKIKKFLVNLGIKPIRPIYCTASIINHQALRDASKIFKSFFDTG